MQFALTGYGGNAEQGLQQAPADAQRTESRGYHERKFGPGVARDILGVADHFATDADGEHGDPIALIDRVEAVQQRQVGRFAMRKVTLVEALAIHRGEKSGHPLAILGDGGA